MTDKIPVNDVAKDLAKVLHCDEHDLEVHIRPAISTARRQALDQAAEFLERVASKTHQDHGLKKQALNSAAQTIRNSKVFC